MFLFPMYINKPKLIPICLLKIPILNYLKIINIAPRIGVP